MTGLESNIDFTKIEFPSDDLTIKTVRNACPDAIDVDRSQPLGRAPYRRYIRRSLDSVLGEELLDVERLLAERAFKVAMGQSVKNDDRVGDKDELVDILATSYSFYGLARGEHEASILIRKIEIQAESQAHGILGRPR